MSVIFPWTVQDSAGNGQAGRTVRMRKHSDSSLIGTFTDAGNGKYYLAVTTTQKVKIEVDGAVATDDDGIMCYADDMVTAAALAYAFPPGGASLVGIGDSAARYAGTTVEQALEEVFTQAELAATTGTSGAERVGIEDAGGYYSGSTVEGALSEIGPVKAALSGITASAAELNKLDGAGGAVTAANLTTLCSAGDATILHTHDMDSLIGNTLVPSTPQDESDADLWLKAGDWTNTPAHRGNVVLDVADPDNPGRAYVRKNNDADVPTTYEIATDKEIGDLNFLGYTLLQQATNLSQALRLLHNAAYQVSQGGWARQIIDRGGTSAGSGATDAAADPATTILYSRKAGSYQTKRRTPWVQLPQHRLLRGLLYLQADSATNYGYAKLACAGVEMELKVDAVAGDSYLFTLDLAALPVDAPTDRTLTVQLKGNTNGSDGVYMMAWFEIWLEQ